MASLNETSKQLNEIEQKVKSLAEGIGQLNKESKGNSDLSAYIMNSRIQLEESVNQVAKFKESLKGIDSSGKGINELASKIESFNNTLNEQINTLNVWKNTLKSVDSIQSNSGNGISKKISETEKARREILDRGKAQGMPISASEKADIYTEHLDKTKPDSNDYYNVLDKQLSNIAKAANDKAKEILYNTQREINQYIIDNNQSMPHDIKMNILQTAFEELDKLDKAAALKISNLMAKEIGKYNKSRISNNNTDPTKESIKNINEESKKYVSTQEALTGNKMNYGDQIAYYDKQIDKIKQLSEKTEDYIEILKLKRKVEETSKNSISDIQSKFNAKTPDFSSALKVLKKGDFNTSGIDKYIQKVNTIRPELFKAMSTGDADKTVSLWNEYSNAIDKVVGKSRAFEIAQQSAASSQKESIRSLYEETKNYVSTQETLNNKKISYADQAAYYGQQANKLKSLGGETREYIEVLKLKQQAEQKAADETRNSAEKAAAAQAKATQQAKDRITTTLNMVKSFANGINSAVNKVISIIRTGISLINKIISTTGAIINKITTGVKSIISLFGGLSNRVRSADGSGLKLNGTFNLLRGSATELRSKILLLKGALSTLFNNNMVSRATKLMSSVMSLDVIIGDDLTKSTLEWANGMQDAFGVDARGLISDLQEVTGVLKGLGMNNQDISVMGPNLLSISRYLAMMGLAGGDAEMAMSKITSGLKGMTQSIDDLGLSVRESEMNDFLKKLKQQGGELANIGTKYANLNEEARIYVRSASILQQFLTNFGTFNSDLSEYVFNVSAFTRTLNSVTGRILILKQTWTGFLSTIGSGLMKVAAVVAGYIIPVLRKATADVEEFFAWLSELTGLNFGVSLGSDLNSLENLEDSSGSVKETTDGVSDLNDELEKVDENAKKAKGSLQSFDRVNNVSSSSSSSSDSNKDNFDYAKVLGGFNKLLDPLDKEYEKFLDSLNEKNQKWWNQFKKWIIQQCKEITGRIDFDLGFDWDKIKQSLVHIKDNVLSLIKNWGTFFIEIGLKFADDINIGAITTSILNLVDAVTGLASAFSNWLTPVLSDLYDKYLSPLVSSLGQAIVDKLDEWSNKIKYITALIKILTGQPLTLDELILTNESETFNEDLEDMRAKLDDFQAKLDDIFKKISDGIRYLTGQMSLDEVIAINEDDSGWATFLKTLDAVKYIISEIAKDLAEWAKNDALPWLSEKLKELGNYISEHREDITHFLETLASYVWDSFKIFVDLMGKLVAYCIENPETVIKVLESIAALKIGSAVVSGLAGMASSIFGIATSAQMIKTLGGLSTILGGGAATGGAAASGAAAAGGALTAETLIPTAGTLGAAEGAASGAAAAGGVALGPIAAVVAIVVALTAAIVDLWNTSEQFRESVKNAWEMIKNGFESIKEAIEPAIENLKGAFSSFYESYESSGLKMVLDTILSFVVEVLGGVLSAALSLIGEVIGTVINLLGDLFVVLGGVIDLVMGIFKVIAGLIAGLVTGDFTVLKEGLGQLVTGILEILGGLLESIIDLAGGLVGWIGEIGENIFGGLFEGMSTAWKKGIANVKEWFNNWINSIKEFFGIHSPSTLFAEIGSFLIQGLLKGIQDLWSKLTETVTGLCSKFVDGIKTKLTNIKDAGVQLVNNIKSGITGAWSSLTSKIGELCSNLVRGIKEKISSGISGLKDSVTGAFDGIKNTASNAWNKITGNTAANKAKSVTATSNAVGGSIAGGQFFVANENGDAELIGNIDGSHKTNVANNNMIIEAMTAGVFEGVYNALAEVNNQRVGNNMGGGNTTIKLDGFGLIDSSTLGELARMLAPYLSSNNKNIADINFSI